jgi:hypothetical protein
MKSAFPDAVAARFKSNRLDFYKNYVEGYGRGGYKSDSQVQDFGSILRRAV